MTALCSGSGPSAPNTGLPTDFLLTASAIANAFTLSGNPFLSAFAAAIGSASYHLATFCTSDPPGYPTWTTADLAALFSLNDVTAFAVAQAKLRQTIDTWVWYQSCHCVTGPTPLSPAPPAAPTGAPVINPPNVGAPFPGGVPCYQAQIDFSATTGTSVAPGDDQPINGATFVSIVGSVTGANPTSGSYGGAVQFRNASGGFTGPGPYIQVDTSGPSTGRNIAVPALTTTWRFVQSNVGAYVGTNDFTATLSFFCGDAIGGAGTTQTPCAPDPLTQNLLQQILQLVTLVQRNAVPFAYIPGASHSALTGDGILTIPSCVGMLLTITTVPGYSGVELGSPNEIFDIGWFSWGTADGFGERVLIHKNPQLSFPDKASQFTRFGYSLNPGVVATIQELYAET